jgi:long-chain fatty acid adenylyltransferase FadD28
MIEASIPAVLRERAGLQPDDAAFTFIGYEQDEAGVAACLTWSQLYRRTLNVANELRLCASPGDRAVISAPQGLDYIVAFLGALQAGLIAVPVSVPLGGASDERVGSVLRDASPSVVLTTSAVASTSAISKSHGLSVADLVPVEPGSIPITTSGKVRRATCVEWYRNNEFKRLDV